MSNYYGYDRDTFYDLYHYGVKGMKWKNHKITNTENNKKSVSDDKKKENALAYISKKLKQQPNREGKVKKGKGKNKKWVKVKK